jgi:ribose transport system substrate-binding protein
MADGMKQKGSPLSARTRGVVEPILRAAEILRAFGSDGSVLRLRDVVLRTGLHKATASRLLRSLEAAGLIENVLPRGFRSLTKLEQTRKIRIGYASQDEQAQFSREVTESLSRAARLCGAELIVFDNQFDPTLALQNVDSLIRERVDAAIEFGTMEKISDAVAARFTQAGIPLISVDMPMPGAVFYGANNYEAGMLAGHALGRWARDRWNKEADHLLLIELPDAGALPQLRLTGALAGIRETLPGFRESRIVRFDGGNGYWQAAAAVSEWLVHTRKGRCLVAAVNDPGALGAIHAFREACRTGDCVAVGQNCTFAARTELRIQGSPLIGSVAYYPQRYGDELMRLALDLVWKKPVASAVYAQHRLVTATNVDRLFPDDRGVGSL